MIDTWHLCLVHRVPSLCHRGGPSSLHCSLWARPDHRCDRAQSLHPSRDNHILTLPKIWIWDSGMRICSCIGQDHVCLELWGSELGCVKIKGTEAVLSGDTTMEQMPSEKQNKAVWPQKKREWRKLPALGSRFQTLGRTSYIYCAWSKNIPLCLYDCPLQFQARYYMGVCFFKPKKALTETKPKTPPSTQMIQPTSSLPPPLPEHSS